MQLTELVMTITGRETKASLVKDPCAVYRAVRVEGAGDEKTARLVQITLLANAMDLRKKSQEEIAAYFRKVCCLNEKAADRMAGFYWWMFCCGDHVYGKEIAAAAEAERTARKSSALRAQREARELEEALDPFCQQPWILSLDTSCVWFWWNKLAKVTFTSAVRIQVIDRESLREGLERTRTGHAPYTEESVGEQLQREMQKKLERDFIDFVSGELSDLSEAEEYKYRFVDLVEDFCDEYGLNNVGQDYQWNVLYPWKE